jgi:hypothetical protein
VSLKKTKYLVSAISFSGQEELYEAAKRKAKTLRRSFSNYVCGLIEADLKTNDPDPRGQGGFQTTDRQDKPSSTIVNLGNYGSKEKPGKPAARPESTSDALLKSVQEALPSPPPRRRKP